MFESWDWYDWSILSLWNLQFQVRLFTFFIPTVYQLSLEVQYIVDITRKVKSVFDALRGYPEQRLDGVKGIK